MKALLINSLTREITEVEGNFQDYREIAKFLKCEYIEGAHTYDNNDTIFVDEEGLFNHQGTGFEVADSHQEFFVGNGILVGHTNSGNSRDAKTKIEELKSQITFCYI
jgi:hypothetical protein